jgi:hypothetical protein
MTIEVIGLIHLHAAFTLYAIASLASVKSESKAGDVGRAIAIVILCIIFLAAMGAGYEAGH